MKKTGFRYKLTYVQYNYKKSLRYFIKKEKDKYKPGRQEFIRKFGLTDDNPFKIRTNTENSLPQTIGLSINIEDDKKLKISKFNQITLKDLREIEKLKDTDEARYNKIFRNFNSEYFKKKDSRNNWDNGNNWDNWDNGNNWRYYVYKEKELSEKDLCFGKMNTYDKRRIIYFSTHLLFLISIISLGIDLYYIRPNTKWVDRDDEDSNIYNSKLLCEKEQESCRKYVQNYGIKKLSFILLTSSYFICNYIYIQITLSRSFNGLSSLYDYFSLSRKLTQVEKYYNNHNKYKKLCCKKPSNDKYLADHGIGIPWYFQINFHIFFIFQLKNQKTKKLYKIIFAFD